MKNLAVVLSSICFSLLFFEQGIGLNLFLFSILSLIILFFKNPEKFRYKTVLLTSVLYFLSGVFVFINNSSLAIFANILSFITVLGTISESKASIYLCWLNGLYSTVAGYFQRSFEQKSNPPKTKRKYYYSPLQWIRITLIPFLILVIFIILYKNGNPLFNSLVDGINFDFINFQWLLFTAIGFYLINNFISPVKASPITEIDLAFGNNLHQRQPFSEIKLREEKQLGTTILLMLNSLIIIFIITDIISLINTNDYTATSLSNEVHRGIYTLIISLIMAIVIIIYFFRGNLNFYKKNKILKQLTYTWILLNAILVSLIIIKNYRYIDAFGFTYKRIGVYVYLTLVLIGLITTFIKVNSIKNLHYLFRMNTSIAFVILISASSINWDKSITIHNLNNAEVLDIEYLLSLSDNNAEILYEFQKIRKLSNASVRNIQTKYNRWLISKNDRSWQELTLENFL